VVIRAAIKLEPNKTIKPAHMEVMDPALAIANRTANPMEEDGAATTLLIRNQMSRRVQEL